MTVIEATNTHPAAVDGNTAGLALVRVRQPEELTPEERAEIEKAVQRIERFPADLGWLLIYVGVLGVVLPGIVGFPLVIAGGAVVMPGGRKRLAGWVGRNPGKMVRASLKQIVRLADDIERRFPTAPGTSA